MASDALELAAQAAKGFQVLECEQCARNIQNALMAAGHKAQIIELKGVAGGDYMVCFSHGGGQETITQNGRHVGVRVGDIVFDNLHPDGLPFDHWLKDFHAVGGVKVIAATDF